MKLDYFSHDTLANMVRDLHTTVIDLVSEVKYQESAFNDGHLIRKHMADQLIELAEGLDSRSALAILGAVSDAGFKISAIKAYRQVSKTGLKESIDAIDNWRGVLGLSL